MDTIQDLVASTDVPDESKPRLRDVMKQIGYAENDAVDSVVSTLTMDDLEKAANKAGLKPPLTIREQRALLARLQPSGEQVLVVRRAFWNPTLCRVHLPFRLDVYRRSAGAVVHQGCTNELIIVVSPDVPPRQRLSAPHCATCFLIKP